MKVLRRLGEVVAVLALSTWAVQADAATFKVDQSKSELVVQTFKEGLAAALAHDHVVRAPQMSGQVEFEPGGDTGSISMEVKTNSLQIDEMSVRKKYGLQGGPSDGDRETISKNMKAEDQLNTAKFPTITFKSTKIQKTGDGQYQVTGDLTIRGKTNQVSFPAKVEMQGSNFHGKGQIKFNQSSFGYQPYSGVFGTVKNKDGVILNIDIVAVPAS